MKIVNTFISGLLILETNIFYDERGKFIKTYNEDLFKRNGLNITIKETYFSVSKKNVIRGMHFQIPPYDHIKLVYVPYGQIIDVVLDIRKGSPTYGKYFDIELSSNIGKVLVIPKGLAHGFKSLKDNTNVTYMQSTCYDPVHDTGIKYDSFGYNWDCDDPIISDRDLSFKPLSEYVSPFIFGVNS